MFAYFSPNSDYFVVGIYLETSEKKYNTTVLHRSDNSSLAMPPRRWRYWHDDESEDGDDDKSKHGDNENEDDGDDESKDDDEDEDGDDDEGKQGDDDESEDDDD